MIDHSQDNAGLRRKKLAHAENMLKDAFEKPAADSPPVPRRTAIILKNNHDDKIQQTLDAVREENRRLRCELEKLREKVETQSRTISVLEKKMQAIEIERANLECEKRVVEGMHNLERIKKQIENRLDSEISTVWETLHELLVINGLDDD